MAMMPGPTMKLLLVEDSPGDALIVRTSLERLPDEHVETDHVETLAAALDRLAANTYHGVLLDLGLPDARGIDVVRRVRERSDEVPIVVLTGRDDLNLAVHAVREGADDYLVKGKTSAELVHRSLRYATERRRMLVDLQRDALLVETLHRVGELLTAELDMNNLLPALAAEATRVTEADYGVILHEQSDAAGGQHTHRVRSGDVDDAVAVERSAERLIARAREQQVVCSHEALEVGSERWSALASPITSRDGEVVAVLLLASRRAHHFAVRRRQVAQGICSWARVALENARLYEQARRAVAARDAMVAVVSHDLRNPLQSVMHATSLLAALGLASPKPVTVLQRAAQLMTRLIDDLLDVSQMESGRFTVNAAPCQVVPLLRGVLEQQQALAEGADIGLEIDIKLTNPLSMKLDADRIAQVVGNLVGNAIKFSPARSNVEVSANGDGEVLRFEVRDRGPGVPPSRRGKVFEPYFRGSSRLPGAGLGLAISRGIIEAHGGKIGVESHHGGGSVFWFTLPM